MTRIVAVLALGILAGCTDTPEVTAVNFGAGGCPPVY
jgi:hypothetical protein